MKPNFAFEHELIAALLKDAATKHSGAYHPVAFHVSFSSLEKGWSLQGIRFLTETLPSVGKSFDSALSSGQFPLIKTPGDDIAVGLAINMLSPLIRLVFDPNGELLSVPCVSSVRAVRQITYCFYKYEIPYSSEQELKVLNSFIETERILEPYNKQLMQLAQQCTETVSAEWGFPPHVTRVLRKARASLESLFRTFDPHDISPQHGPGVVSTKETLHRKYVWSDVPEALSAEYPIDEYFYPCMDAVVDSVQEIKSLGSRDVPAQILFVPKDSRGPRLISCEPLVKQWIQQGLRKAIVGLVESHPLTRDAVHFTDQRPNQIGALVGSANGRYATLDLKDASDRVTCGLVHLLFPKPLVAAMESCRSSETVLPNGGTIKLQKFAPMGSALCFPTLALTIWSILNAAAQDRYTRERILVYGDDLIVPRHFASSAIMWLEAVGLKVNVDKSYTVGGFRESCGLDAFYGEEVQPIRFRSVWESSQSPNAYCSWIATANQLYSKQYYMTYDVIVGRLVSTYGPIPEKSLGLQCPSLIEVPEEHRHLPFRFNRQLQKGEWLTWQVVAQPLRRVLPGWKMLLRYFAEGTSSGNANPEVVSRRSTEADPWHFVSRAPFSVRLYTKRDSVKLEKRWQ